ARPDDGYLPDLAHRPRAPAGQHLTEGPVGEDPRVVVDAAVALGLADDRDDAVGFDLTLGDEVVEPAGVGDAFDGDFPYFDRLGHRVSPVFRAGYSTTVPARPLTASASRPSEVMAARVPPDSTK